MIRGLALLLGIIVLHVLALIWLADATRLHVLVPKGQTVTQVEFVNMPRPTLPLTEVLARPSPINPGKRSGPQVSVRVRRDTAVQVPDAEAFRVLDSEGQIWIPQTALDEFHAGAENRSFEIGRAGQNDMLKLLHRPVVLDYRSTRFDDAWQGDKPPLTRVLEKAVEKTTATIKIPVPGRPGAFLQCKIMVLAASGGCGFIANDDGYFVLPDDPNTLSPEEDKQCQAWWDLIVSAKTQGEWRRTRALYDKECRKPLLQP